MTNTNEESGFGTGETALTTTTTHESSNKQPYPTSAKEYQITDEIGRGVSGVVWKATIPSKQNEQVAIKVLDLEDQDQNYLEEIRREAQTMGPKFLFFSFSSKLQSFLENTIIVSRSTRDSFFSHNRHRRILFITPNARI